MREEKAKTETESERSAFINDLRRKATPSFEFFLFTFFCGIALGAAILLDSPALFILATLLAPFMAPAIGLGLSAVIGSVRFFLQSLASMLLGSFIIFGLGAISGWLSKLLHLTTFKQVSFHSMLSIPDGLLLAIGVILTVILFIRPRNQRPLVTSVAIAYELYLPIGVAGFGLTSGIAKLWPDGLVVFSIHLTATVFLVMIILVLKRIKFRNAFGYIILSVLILLGILVGLYLGGVFSPPPMPISAPATSAPTTGPAATGTWTPVVTPKMIKSTDNSTPTNTLIPTTTATATLTPMPTLVQAYIHAEDSNGAYVRIQPNFNANLLTTLLNGNLVYVLPEIVDNGGATWVHIRLTDGREGWIVRSLLATATPAPTW
jgi:hypothetical protein